MTRVVAVANQKGGVGKTTTSVNLSASLALSGGKVLLVDLDPQGNATMGCGVDKHSLDATIYEWLVEAKPLKEIVRHCQGGFDVLPSNLDLTAAEVALMNSEGREYFIKKRLAEQAGDYDYVIIDCPPSLSILTVNALIASNGVLIPMQCEYYALEGLSVITHIMDQLCQSRANPDICIEGIVMTMYDARTRLSSEVVTEVRSHFGELVYDTIIPRNVRLSEAPSFGQPVIMYDPYCSGAEAYRRLAKEVLQRTNQPASTPSSSV